MNSLNVYHSDHEQILDQKHYFESLIKQARNRKLLTDNEIIKIQTDLLILLSKQTDKWNRGENSSIPTEKAIGIMASMMYVIGIQLKTYLSFDLAIETIKTVSVESLFEKGLKIINQKVKFSRSLQKKIVKNLLNTENIFYRSTIFEGINGFFKLYRPQFSAHEIHITVDYPIFIGRPKLDGIEFIEKYLCYVEAENSFCILFSSKDIHHLLCGLTNHYQNVPMNIFEPVLLSALGLVLLHRDPIYLNLTESNVKQLYHIFLNKSEEVILITLKDGFELLNQNLRLTTSSKKYILLCLPKLSCIVKNAVNMNTLDKVFLIPFYPEQESKILFFYEERMEDKKYRELLDKMWELEKSEEKTTLILKEVHSMMDLLDILQEGNLFEEDVDHLVESLPLPLLIALMKQYPTDDFIETESEQFLFKAINKRKIHFSEDEKRKVEAVMCLLGKENIY